MKYRFFICLSLVFLYVNGFSNSDFYNKLKQEDPDSINVNSSFEGSFKLHKNYLDKATNSRDTLRQIFGLIYLFNDYVKNIDYEQAGKYIFKAESLAQTANNNCWLGWINHKKGALNVHLRDFPLAIKYYTKSIEFCKKSLDSLGLALNYEQLCSMHGQLKNYDSAHYYFSMAEPLLETYADKNALSVALINYGSVLVYQGQYEKAIPYFNKASLLCTELENTYRKVQCDQNLAVAYVNVGKYEAATALFKNVIEINKKNSWSERLFYNYHGLSQLYMQIGNYKEALKYYMKFHKLKDSVIQEQTKVQINNLEAKSELAQQTRLLEESQSDLITTKLVFHRSILIFGVFIIALFGVLYIFYYRAKQTKEKHKIRKEKLESLTQLLIEKNTFLSEMDKEISHFRKLENTTQISNFDENNVYNNRILTDSDWFAFKASFEDSYPGFIRKLNMHHGDLSEAEQRIFLFIKLGLKSKDASAILGISVDSVKKARYRLKKRLDLDENESLDDYIINFQFLQNIKYNESIK